MTHNQPAVVDNDEFTVQRTIVISAPVEKVWAAITEADSIARWFGQSVVLEGIAVGAIGVFSFEGYGGFPVRIEELDAPRTIAYRWGSNNADGIDPLDPSWSTVFRFTRDPVDGGTRLTVVEWGFGGLVDPVAAMEGNRRGWDSELDELVAYLEGGS